MPPDGRDRGTAADRGDKSGTRAPDLPKQPPHPRPATAEQANMQAALAEQAAQKGIVERDAAHVEAQRTAKSLHRDAGLLKLAGDDAARDGANASVVPAASSPAHQAARADPAVALALRQLEHRLVAAGVAGVRAGAGATPNSAATQAARVDTQLPAWDPPEPQLFFLDQEDGSRLLIWSPNDTLPRDVARPRRPEVWLYCFVAADAVSPAALLHFLEHYSRQGIPPERMQIVLQRRRAAPLRAAPGDGQPGAAAGDGGADALGALLRAWGVDHRLWLGVPGSEARLRLRLQVLRSVPVQDWVLLPEPDELFDFGNFTAAGFLAQRDVDGANWVEGAVVDRVHGDGALAAVDASSPVWSQFSLSCADGLRSSAGGARVSDAGARKVVAHKGYWRTTADGARVLAPDEARAYFGWQGDCDVAEDLSKLTPYHAYWKYYRARLMTGNSYLWEPRRSAIVATVHRFRWHAGAAAWLRGESGALTAATCARRDASEREQARSAEDLLAAAEALERARGVDARDCAPARNPYRFPLPAAARVALLATRF